MKWFGVDEYGNILYLGDFIKQSQLNDSLEKKKCNGFDVLVTIDEGRMRTFIGEVTRELGLEEQADMVIDGLHNTIEAERLFNKQKQAQLKQEIAKLKEELRNAEKRIC